MKYVLVIFLGLIAISGIYCNSGGSDRKQLTELYHWDLLHFHVPPNRLEQAIASRSYIPNKNGIMAVGVWRDKMFVSIFRLSTGVLSSLNYFLLNTTDESPVLYPYPSFDANYVNEDPENRTVSLPSPASVINSAHFKIDKCDRLWIIDSGYTDDDGKRRTIASPAIVIFDLTSDTLIRRVEIPHQFFDPLAVLADIDVDFESDNCDDVHAYVTDTVKSIIVYSFKKDRIWQVAHRSMEVDPKEGHFEYANISFHWIFGVYAVVVGDLQRDGSKRVYFSSLTSTKIYDVSNRVLQDENYVLGEYIDEFHLLGDSGKGWETSRMAYDVKTGSVFNSIFADSTIACWNVKLPIQSFSTVHKTSSEFFPGSLHIDANRNLWVISDLVPLEMYAELPVGGRNIRIFKETVDRAIAGTNCKAQKS